MQRKKPQRIALLGLVRGLWVAGLMGSVWACQAELAPARLSPREIEAPPGPDSGEPTLSVGEDGSYLSWLERPAAGHELRFSRWDGSEWTEPVVVASSDRFFVNWADLPAVAPDAEGVLWGRWLQRGDGGGYGIRVVRSLDGGATWSDPWTPHATGLGSEHGFVADMAVPGGRGFAWLDGRKFTMSSVDPRDAAMALYYRTLGADGAPGAETLVDDRVCDCCQTDAALTEAGPVIAYRDRSPEEIRDIYVTRWLDGAWSEGVRVHDDGWETGACPVNGPAIDAIGERVAVAWFTAAEGIPRVRVAFSDDSGARFGDPITVDDGDPAGRVDLAMLEDGSAVVTWMERTEGESTEVRAKHVRARSAGESVRVSTSKRAGGVPRMARAADGSIMVAWTDVDATLPRVRVTALDVLP